MIELNHKDVVDVIKDPEITVVEFYADGCHHCGIMEKVLESLEMDYLDILFAKTPAHGVSMQLDISGMPTTIAFKNSKRIGALVGAKDITTVRAWLNEMVSIDNQQP